MVVDHYPNGYEFITENKPNDKLFLIVEGKVVATRRRTKLRGLDVLGPLGPGDLFGQVALIDRGLPLATCRADGPDRLLLSEARRPADGAHSARQR